MPDVYKVEILETWKKTVSVEADNRSAAVAKVKADYAQENAENGLKGIKDDPEAVRFDVDIKLAWPDGK
jgi:hypothetical protein